MTFLSTSLPQGSGLSGRWREGNVNFDVMFQSVFHVQRGTEINLVEINRPLSLFQFTGGSICTWSHSVQ